MARRSESRFTRLLSRSRSCLLRDLFANTIISSREANFGFMPSSFTNNTKTSIARTVIALRHYCVTLT